MNFEERKSALLEKLLLKFDKEYNSHYDQLISEVTKKIDLVLQDLLTQIKSVNSETSVSRAAMITVSFKEELSKFFGWATHYSLYRFHYFYGYDDIIKILLERSEIISAHWIDSSDEVKIFIRKTE